MGDPRPVTADVKGLVTLQRQVASGRPVKARFCRRADIEPLIGTFGITRVADQTDLDRIGVPVFSAIRPLSRGLTVSTGKGVTAESAWLSAVFESVEQSYAERASDLCAYVQSIAEMKRAERTVIPFERQPRCAASRLHDGLKLAWVRGVSLITGETVYAPYNLIGLDMAAQSPWSPDMFLMASNGLAAGGNLVGAVLQGLRELVEDDAFMLASRFPIDDVEAGDTLKIDYRSGDPLPDILRKLGRAGLEASFMTPKAGLGVPAIVATLVPMQKATETRIFSGVACRDKLEDAALAAVLEAIQTRLTFVAGSREDLFSEDYLQSEMRNLRGFRKASLHERGDSVRDDDGLELHRLIEALKDNKISGIYAFPLGGMEGVFEIVRVLADDLMSVEHIPGAAMPEAAGRRLLDGMLSE